MRSGGEGKRDGRRFFFIVCIIVGSTYTRGACLLSAACALTLVEKARYAGKCRASVTTRYGTFPIGPVVHAGLLILHTSASESTFVSCWSTLVFLK